MKKLILIIDDDPDLRGGLKRGLEQSGFAALSAESAEEAREIMLRIRPDAIVLDRMMTGMDGLSFLREIRAAGDAVPVIMLTAMNGAAHAIEGLSAEADDYLAKPFQLRELALRLNNTMKKSPAAQPTGVKMPEGLTRSDGEFFADRELLALSENEKAALALMISGETAPMPPMTARRLRAKLLANIKNADIINVRNKGYKLVVK